MYHDSTGTDFSSICKLDYSWIEKLNRLLTHAKIMQYQVAYLSTIGGAYHLSNDPKSALVIAKRQEAVARGLGSTSALVKQLYIEIVSKLIYLIGAG